MEVMYRISATSTGGRDGHVRSSDGILDMDMRPPKEMGGPGGVPNPEMLFAAGYAACFNTALNLAARLKKVNIGQTKVTVEVTLGKNDNGSFQLAARINTVIPGVSAEMAKELTEDTTNICPYSRATKGNIVTELNSATE